VKKIMARLKSDDAARAERIKRIYISLKGEHIRKKVSLRYKEEPDSVRELKCNLKQIEEVWLRDELEQEIKELEEELGSSIEELDVPVTMDIYELEEECWRLIRAF
jgi:hypothetical protein